MTVVFGELREYEEDNDTIRIEMLSPKKAKDINMPNCLYAGVLINSDWLYIKYGCIKCKSNSFSQFHLDFDEVAFNEHGK